jgi:membrane protein
LRWPFLFGIALLGLAIVFRYAPSREKPRWEWLSPGALTATLVWLVASVLFSIYAQNFGSYNKTYGSLAAVVVLMTWLYLSSWALLLGGEVNAVMERRRTAHDSREYASEGRGPESTNTIPKAA